MTEPRAKKPGKIPAFSFYPKDLLADAMHLSNEEFGAYWRLCCVAWVGVDGCPQGYLPGDDAKLARLVGESGARWKRLAAAVLPLFRRDDATGRLYSKRQLEELARMHGRSETARTSAERRWGRSSDANASGLHPSSHGFGICGGDAARTAEAAAEAADEVEAGRMARAGEREGEGSGGFDPGPWLAVLDALYPAKRRPSRGQAAACAAWLAELAVALGEVAAELTDPLDFACRLFAWCESDDWAEKDRKYIPPAERFVRRGDWHDEPRRPRDAREPGYQEDLAAALRACGLEDPVVERGAA